MKTANKIITGYVSSIGELGRLPIYLKRLSGIEPIEVDHSKDIKEDLLFCEIDKAIKYLEDLKSQGFQEIRQCWSGYEDNYFVAIKRELETGEEFASRIFKRIREISNELNIKEEEESKRKKRIAELQDELSKLKKEGGMK